MANKRFNQITRVVTSFDSNDVLPIGNGTLGDGKMTGDQLLELTAQNALADNVAPAFDPTRTSENPYRAGERVTYLGKTYTFKKDHYGAWASGDIFTGITPFGTNTARVFSGGYVMASLKDCADNTIHFIQRDSGLTTTDFPSDAPVDANYLFVSIRVNSSSSQYQREQRLINLEDNHSWIRQYNSINGVWTSWAPSYKALDINKNQLFANWNKNPASLNDVAENSVLRLTVNSSTTTTNIPSDFLVGSVSEGTLFTFKCYYSTSDYRIYQILLRDSDGMMWTRFWQSSWRAWVAKTIPNFIPLEENQIFHTSSTNPASLNDLMATQVVRVWRDSSVTTTNFPSDYPVGANVRGTLTIYKAYSAKPNNQYQIFQILTLDSSSEKWTRFYNSINSTWSSWTKAALAENAIIIGSGQQYTTLRAGLAEAYSRDNAEVIIMPGVYDCVTEWSAEMHAVEEDSPVFGNPVGKNMHIVAMPGAKIKALVEREDFQDLTEAKWRRLRNYFEPFGARSGSFIVENLDIESKNTRYCFHDDSGTSAPSVRKFLNCRMLRHTDYDEAIHNPTVACIGGGLSLKETVVIDGGWYRTEPNYGNLDIMEGDVDYAQVPISYHQNAGNSCEASITIKNVCLDDKGFFRFGYYGTSAEKCKVLVSGCRMKYPPLLCRETTGSTVENFEVVEWCNEVVESGHWETDNSGQLNSTWVPDNE